MPRIPENDLERLKREVSVERLVTAAGVELTRRGADLVGICPFHEDGTPSLVVTPKKNLWHCLGACQAGGDAIEWVKLTRRVSFRHAVELLREHVNGAALPGLTVGTGALGGDGALPVAAGVKASTVRALPSPVSADGTDGEVMAQVTGYYQAALQRSRAALDYLVSRGLGSPELIEHFQLGYCDRTLTYRVPERNRVEGARIRERLAALGVLRESGHEHLRGSIVVPLHDESGQVVGMYGRKIGDRLRAGTPMHLYLPGPHRAVWNLDALRASREVIWCEALFDAMSFWAAGLREVSTSYGVEGFKELHLEALRRHGVERVRIAYDADEAGDRAAAALAQKLGAAGIECWRVQFPRGLDANAFALRAGSDAARALEAVVRNATWLGKGPRVATASEGARVGAEGAPPLAASPAAGAPAAALHNATPASAPYEVLPDGVSLTVGDRVYRAQGVDGKLPKATAMRVTVRVQRRGQPPYVDTVDLCSRRQREAFVAGAAVELGLEADEVKRDLGAILMALDEAITAQVKTPAKNAAPEMSEGERAEALALLRDPRLLERIVEDFERCGVVGERTNKLVGYVAAVSRKLESPLAVIIQSSSAAGKSSLMEAVLELVPEEDRIKYSAMTGQSLFYMGETDLKHKLLAIVEEEGADRAAYSLKLLQSEKELTIASTSKDPKTGDFVAKPYRVEGPVMIMLMTTATELDEELLNRCVVLTVDEDREQTRAIHRQQREGRTLEGMLKASERRQVRALHRNAQRLLRSLPVVNPYALELTFADDRTRTRRDHTKYLTLIDALALLRQHQREIQRREHLGQTIEYVVATRDDIADAERLGREVLRRSFDELASQTRRMLERLSAAVRSECERTGMRQVDYRFTRRQAREWVGMSETQSRLHLERLMALEYVVPHRGGRGLTYVYELVGEHDDATSGAAAGTARAVEDARTTSTSRGKAGDFAEPTGHFAGTSRGARVVVSGNKDADEVDFVAVQGVTDPEGESVGIVTYPQVGPALNGHAPRGRGQA